MARVDDLAADGLNGSSTPPGAAMNGGDVELPQSYGRSRLVLLAVDPFHVHAYWETTLSDRVEAMEQIGMPGEKPEWVLRFYDVTCVDFDGTNAHGHFDVTVAPNARNWYVELWSPDKTYFAEIGLHRGTEFVPVCRSNCVHVPRADPSPRVEEPPAPEPATTQDGERPATPATTAVSGEEYAQWLHEHTEPEPAVSSKGSAEEAAAATNLVPQSFSGETAMAGRLEGPPRREAKSDPRTASGQIASGPSRSVSLGAQHGFGSSIGTTRGGQGSS